MRRSARASLVIAALAAVVAAPARLDAQGLGNGTIEGVIREANGRPVPSVAITLVNDQTGRQLLLRATRDGKFRTGFIAPGTYRVLFEQFGFTPERVENLEVQPGQRTNLPVTLVRAEGAVNAESIQSIVVPGGTENAPQTWSTARTASAMPLDASNLASLGMLSSRAGPLLDVEGLPAWLSRIVVDGVPVAPRPRELDSFARYSSFALSSFDRVDQLTVAPDVEWPGAAAGYFTALTRQGSRRIGGQLFGDYGGDALGGEAGAAPYQNYRLGGQLGGPIVRDSVHFIVGGEVLRSEVPFESLWVSDTETARLVDILDDDYTIDRYARPTVGGLERVSGFGRLDLMLGENHDLSVRAHAAILPRIQPILPRTGLLLGPGTTPDAQDIFATATLTSRIGEEMSNEFNAAFELGRYEREANAADPDALDLPATSVHGAGRIFGFADRSLYSSKLTGIYLRETVHDRRGSHSLKYGLSAFAPTHELSFDQGTAGEFTFPSIDDFIQRRGAHRRTEGVPHVSKISFRHYTFFAQDAWSPSPDLEVTFGLRYQLSRMPDTADIRPSTSFTQLTGIRNRAITRRPGHLEPIFALRWTPGGAAWVFSGAVVVDGQLIPADAVAEVFSNDGTLESYAGIGDLESWPQAPNIANASRIGPNLSILGPKFRGPQTTRASASVSRSLGRAASFSVSAVVRRTDYLPRRRDLNLLPGPSSTDQHGRFVYGTLVQVGGLVAPNPVTNRRLTEFDRVWGLEASSHSNYTGLTFALSRPVTDGLGLHAAYTYSKTEDDWMIGSGHPESQLTPFPNTLEGLVWEQGTADLDVPHRAVIGAEFKVPGRYGPRIAGLYRFQSGYPFTPGFRDGVDVNGDGSGRNDPAFIDTSIAGIDDIIADWPCLQSQTGSFVKRNSCRGPAQSALDARIGLEVVRTDRYAAQLVIDGLNLLASEDGVVDRALYLIDPVAKLGGDQPNGSVTIPYIINPEFGRVRTRFVPQRLIRLGLRVSY